MKHDFFSALEKAKWDLSKYSSVHAPMMQYSMLSAKWAVCYFCGCSSGQSTSKRSFSLGEQASSCLLPILSIDRITTIAKHSGFTDLVGSLRPVLGYSAKIRNEN